MPHSTPPDPREPRAAGAARTLPQALAAALLATLLCGACALFESPPPPPPPAPAPAPAPAPQPPVAAPDPVDLARPADQIARRLLAYHEQLRLLSPADLAAEITRLNAALTPVEAASPPDVLLDLSLALAQQHNPGDLARAAGLLDPLTQAATPELLPWQGIARLLAGRIAEQRRLDDQVERQAAQLRDTQRTIQQLTEKLEALKAIERSMIKRSTGPGSGVDPAPAGPTH
jgi:hypothetical protein